MQVLGVTCDNASNNDTMIEELARVLPGFAGAPNRVRCFTHVLNLVAKSLIRQFDAEADKDDAADGADERELAELAAGLDAEEAATRASAAAEDDDESFGVDDDTDDEFDALNELSEDEKAQFLEDIRPVKLVLAKVRPRCSSSAPYDEPLTFLHVPASQIRLQGRQLDNDLAPCMEDAPRGDGLACEVDSAGRPDSVEFNLRHVEFGAGVPRCHRPDVWGAGERLA